MSLTEAGKCWADCEYVALIQLLPVIGYMGLILYSKVLAPLRFFNHSPFRSSFVLPFHLLRVLAVPIVYLSPSPTFLSQWVCLTLGDFSFSSDQFISSKLPRLPILYSIIFTDLMTLFVAFKHFSCFILYIIYYSSWYCFFRYFIELLFELSFVNGTTDTASGMTQETFVGHSGSGTHKKTPSTCMRSVLYIMK